MCVLMNLCCGVHTGTKRFPTPDGEEVEFDIVGGVEDFYYLLILHFLFPVFMAVSARSFPTPLQDGTLLVLPFGQHWL